jgi:hypothetical protein
MSKGASLEKVGETEDLRAKVKELEQEVVAARRRADSAEHEVEKAAAKSSEDASLIQARDRIAVQAATIAALQQELLAAKADIAGDLDPGTSDNPGSGRLTDDVAKRESLDPWLYTEVCLFRCDSSYDDNTMKRAQSVVERAFKADRLGISKRGEYTALPPFDQRNRLVVSVAILPPLPETPRED